MISAKRGSVGMQKPRAGPATADHSQFKWSLLARQDKSQSGAKGRAAEYGENVFVMLRANAPQISFVYIAPGRIARLRCGHDGKDKSKAEYQDPEVFVRHLKWLLNDLRKFFDCCGIDELHRKRDVQNGEQLSKIGAAQERVAEPADTLSSRLAKKSENEFFLVSFGCSRFIAQHAAQ
jgi:hypothetical protein